MKKPLAWAIKRCYKTAIGRLRTPKELWVAKIDHKIEGSPERKGPIEFFNFASGFFEGKPRRKTKNKNLTPVINRWRHTLSAQNI